MFTKEIIFTIFAIAKVVTAGVPQPCTPCEIWVDCPDICIPEATCQNPTPVKEYPCCEDAKSVGRCECDAKKGFIRDAVTNKCVNKCDCTCKANEIYNSLPVPCIDEPTCQVPDPCVDPTCIKTKTTGRCECDITKGYIKDTLTGTCVLCAKCPCEDNKSLAFDHLLKKCVPECPKPKIPNIHKILKNKKQEIKEVLCKLL